MKAPALAFAILCATPAWAEPTDIVVRVQSQGAKFVGSSMGGAQVILRDADTGEVLAQGLTVGATGDTKRIMGAANGAPVADEKTAAFRARIDIDLPRLIEVEATGPMAQRQSMARVSAQYWLIPGQPVIGDGWTLILPGLVVDAVEPAAHQRLAKGQETVRIAVNVAMMCGCPIENGGPWDAAGFDVRALITGPDGTTTRLSLPYAGRTGYFAAEWPVPASGEYLLSVSALDRTSGAAGADRSSFIQP